MIQLVILSVFALVAFSTSSKIIRIEDAPYMASISCYEKYIASGAIISKYHVITVAQSFYYIRYKQFSLRVGSSYYMWGGMKIPVSKLHLHPDYNSIGFDHNFLIMELDKSVSVLYFSKTIQPITLPDYNVNVSDKDMVLLSGWGKTTTSVHSRAQLRAVRLPVINTQVCQEQIPWFSITSRMICLGGSTDGRGPCLGDNGAPAILKDQLIGLASMGSDCRKPQGPPSIFALVSSVRKWLDQIVVK